MTPVVLLLTPFTIVKRLAPGIISACPLASFNASFDSKGIIKSVIMSTLIIIIILFYDVLFFYISHLIRLFNLRAEFEKIAILFLESKSFAFSISFTYCLTFILNIFICEVFILFFSSILIE